MGRCVEYIGIILDQGLAAIAVMDIEIDDRDTTGTVGLSGIAGADRNIIEKAETHRLAGFSMVARRADGAERVGDAAAEHRIDSTDDRAGSPQRRFAGTRRHNRVAVNRRVAALWYRGQHLDDMVARMDPLNIGNGGKRRVVALKIGKRRCIQSRHDCLQAGSAFGMMRPGVMVEARRMTEKRSRHGLLPIILRRLSGKNLTCEIERSANQHPSARRSDIVADRGDGVHHRIGWHRHNPRRRQQCRARLRAMSACLSRDRDGADTGKIRP